jgi:hypothetical protein
VVAFDITVVPPSSVELSIEGIANATQPASLSVVQWAPGAGGGPLNHQEAADRQAPTVPRLPPFLAAVPLDHPPPREAEWTTGIEVRRTRGIGASFLCWSPAP